MSIPQAPYVSNIVAGVLISLVSTACAAPPSTPAAEVHAVQSTKKPVGACVIADRPKHTIRRCGCASGAFVGVRSIDAREVLRLLTGDQGCRNPAQPRQ